MIRPRAALVASLLFLAGGASGCATIGDLSGEYARTDDPALTERYGTKQLVASGPAVFAAVEDGLRAQGYDVAIANRGRGLIRTAPKVISMSAYAAGGSARRVERTFQIVATLAPVDDRVKVALTVRHYLNGVDVTARDLVRKNVLVTLWVQLFGAIYDALPPSTATPPPSDVL